jgi:gluconolactonase
MNTDWSRRNMMAGALGAAAMAGVAHAQAPALAQAARPARVWPPAGIKSFDPAFDALVDANAPIEQLMDGIGLPEGPLWVGGKDGYLLVCDVTGNVVRRWSKKDGESEWLKPSGYGGPPQTIVSQLGCGGLILARGGVVMADVGNRGLARINMKTRTKIMIATHFEGRRLQSPNDLVQAADGAIYFTDPTNGLKGGLNSVYKEMDFTAIFRLAPDGKVTVFDKTLVNPNGIGLSPDGKTLYVTHDNKYWSAFDVVDGVGANKRFFVDEKALGIAGGDGLKIDTHGNMWSSSSQGVSVFSPAGKLLGTVTAGPGRHSNCELGADGSLYIAYEKKVARVPVRAKPVRLGKA